MTAYRYDASGRKLSVTHTTSKTNLLVPMGSIVPPQATHAIVSTTDYCGNVIYENGAVSRILTEEGYITFNGTTPVYHYYLKDHQGNNRVVLNQDGAVEQVNHYYPFGGLMGESTAGGVQPYKYNGKELDRMHGLDLFDYGARHYDAAIGRWWTPDPLAEKYYSISPYAYVANSPVNFVDLRGDSLTLAGNKIQETLMAIYNGLEDGTNITMNFNNGVLDPSSIAKQAQNTTDVFLQDLYEIATNPTMVELSISKENTYVINGIKITEEFATAPYDYDIRMETPEAQKQLMSFGEIPGKTVQGNLGQTLIPGNVSASGKSSTNNNVQVIINGKGTLNHRTVGIAHEFGHVLLYLRGLPYSHGQSGVDDFIYNRTSIMLKRLGYDY